MDPLASDLAAWMSGETDDPDRFDVYDDDPPVVADLAEAERLGRRFARAHTELEEIAALAAAERDRITAWEDDRSAGPERVVRWVTRALDGFCRRAHPERRGRVWKLPSVVLRLTAPHASLVVDDDRAAVEFCRDRGLGDAVISHVSRAELRRRVSPGPIVVDPEVTPDEFECYAAVTEDGEIVPGVHFESPRQPTFSVKPTNPNNMKGEST